MIMSTQLNASSVLSLSSSQTGPPACSPAASSAPSAAMPMSMILDSTLNIAKHPRWKDTDPALSRTKRKGLRLLGTYPYEAGIKNHPQQQN
jgi:hypothetical protein